MNELDRYAVSLENMEVLRAQVEAQAREIAALKAQPSGVVLPERKGEPDPIWSGVPYVGRPLNAEDITESRAYNAALDEVASLNQPASGVYSADPMACSGCVSGCFRCLSEPASAGDSALREAVTPNVLEWVRCGLAANNRLVDGDHPALQKLRAAISANHSEQVRHMVPAWNLAADELPASGKTVLAFYLNSHGMGRRIRAMHVKRFTVEAEEFADPDTQCCEYSEQDDCYYTAEGWYELIDNWPDYSSCAVIEGVVTHWMPLPAAPSAGSHGGDV